MSPLEVREVWLKRGCAGVKALHVESNAAAVSKVRRFLASPARNPWICTLDGRAFLKLPSWQTRELAIANSSAPIIRVHRGSVQARSSPAYTDYVLDVELHCPVAREVSSSGKLGPLIFWPSALDDPGASLFSTPAALSDEVRCEVIQEAVDYYLVLLPSVVSCDRDPVWIPTRDAIAITRKSRASKTRGSQPERTESM